MAVIKKRQMSVMDFINQMTHVDDEEPLTKQEFTRIRNFGSEEELKDAVERMEAAGGYDALEDE